MDLKDNFKMPIEEIGKDVAVKLVVRAVGSRLDPRISIPSQSELIEFTASSALYSYYGKGVLTGMLQGLPGGSMTGDLIEKTVLVSVAQKGINTVAGDGSTSFMRELLDNAVAFGLYDIVKRFLTK